MNEIFKNIPLGCYFIDHTRRMAQKTSARYARYGSGPSYLRRNMELAIPIPRSTTCPYTKELQ